MDFPFEGLNMKKNKLTLIITTLILTLAFTTSCFLGIEEAGDPITDAEAKIVFDIFDSVITAADIAETSMLGLPNVEYDKDTTTNKQTFNFDKYAGTLGTYEGSFERITGIAAGPFKLTMDVTKDNVNNAVKLEGNYTSAGKMVFTKAELNGKKFEIVSVNQAYNK